MVCIYVFFLIRLRNLLDNVCYRKKKKHREHQRKREWVLLFFHESYIVVCTATSLRGGRLGKRMQRGERRISFSFPLSLSRLLLSFYIGSSPSFTSQHSHGRSVVRSVADLNGGESTKQNRGCGENQTHKAKQFNRTPFSGARCFCYFTTSSHSKFNVLILIWGLCFRETAYSTATY